MKSIQTKFILLILSCVLLSSIVIGGGGIFSANKVVSQDSAQIMNLLCTNKAIELDNMLSKIEQSVKTLSIYAQNHLGSVESLKNDPEYVNEYTKRLEGVAINAANNTEGALAVYVRYNPEFTEPTSGLFWSKTNLDGSFKKLTPTDFSGYSPADTEHVGWYYIPVKNGKATWMAPYENQNINVKMISYVIPIYMENQTVGVVGMDIDFSVIEHAVSQASVYETGYAFLTDAAGKVVYHPQYGMGTSLVTVDKSLASVVSELNNDTTGSALFDYISNGEEKRMAFRTLRNDMRLAITAPVSEIDTEKNGLILQSIIALVIIAAISVFLTIILTRRMIRPLRELNTAAKKIADGDLSVSITHQTKDEVGTLADSFQQTVNHLQKYISYINGLAYRDPLTGVKNKTAYSDAETRMEAAMRTGRPEFGIVVLDINDLKQVNDKYGHDFGDILIIDACKLICKVFKRSPVYRIGGDEFVVILENSDLENYQEVLEDFTRQMEDQNNSSRIDSRLSIARGIAIYNSETDLVFANVFKRADESMYQNKSQMKSKDAVSKLD